MIALKLAEVNPLLRVQIRQSFAEKIVYFTLNRKKRYCC